MSFNPSPDPTLMKCLTRLGPSAQLALDELKIEQVWTVKKGDIVWNTVTKGVAYYIPEVLMSRTSSVAAFDLDWTLSYGEKALFPKDPEDIHIIPQRREMLTGLLKKGYRLAVFTNQASRSVKERDARLARITTFAVKIGLPIALFVATAAKAADSEYRKPEIGMWTLCQKLLNPGPKSFFCGDAAGRVGDFADSDAKFAESAELPFFTPEQVFPETVEYFPPDTESRKSLVIFVGAPGTGKSTYFHRHLEPLGYVAISQDVLGTKEKVKKVLISALQSGVTGIGPRVTGIVLDATHPQQELREEYYSLAKKYGYSVTVLYMIRDGQRGNAQREVEGGKKVPAIAYHSFFKKLEPPTEENTPGRLFKVSF